MTLGEKIKKARKEKRLTQTALVEDKITRNMLSQIERGNANPSLDTIKFLAERLSLPIAYLISEDDDLFFFEKNEVIDDIYKLYESKNFLQCTEKILSLSSIDDELAYLVATSYFYLSKDSTTRGALQSALKYAEKFEFYSTKTKISTEHFRAIIQLYKAIASNIQSPLLEFDEEKYIDGLCSVFDFEIYKYLSQDYSYPFTDQSISNHIKAKQLIKERNYSEAITLLSLAIESGRNNYNTFIMFGIYADLEYCYKQLYDFEKAYLYSSKRLSMLEGFKS